MIKSNRTKLRRIKAELDNIDYNPQEPQINDILQNDSFSLNCEDDVATNTINAAYDTSSILLDNKSPKLVIDTESNNTFQGIDCSDEDDQFISVETEPNINEMLADWAVSCKITFNSMNQLLSILKKHKCFSKLPKDSRTLLAIPQSSNLKYIRNVDPGIYHHFGLANGIVQCLQDSSVNDSVIQIAIGIDGLPLSKSSNSQLWPILAFIMNTDNSKQTVFPIGIYHGNSKPKDSDDFIHDFVMEARELSDNGIIINNLKIFVSINVICCDVPARCFVLKTKYHSGFNSCSRCIIEGEYINKRVCFPYSNIYSAPRTDEDYRNCKNEEYHNSPNPSIITKLPNFDITKSFILDYMHLTNLGVMRKLLSFWVLKGPSNVRLTGKKISELTELLLKLRPFVTSEFCRKPREVQDILRWKSTEFRLFLIYIGPFVLKDIITDDCYSNFMCLNVAMVILLSPDHQNLSSYAQTLLEYFVETFQNIYGTHNVSHNVHSLLHITSDYERYGPLDKCSCYPFENYMKEIKSMLRKHEKPLQQLINRYSEQKYTKIHHSNALKTCKSYSLKKIHKNGPLPDFATITGYQYSCLIFNNFKININCKRDQFILTNCNHIVQCFNIMETCVNGENGTYILGKHFINKSPAYIKPMDSTILDIYLVDNISTNFQLWNVDKISKKIMILPFKDIYYVALPILHSEIYKTIL